jgi:hypothetical protein
MFEFESPVVAISDKRVLCKDGSIWEECNVGPVEWRQIAKSKKKTASGDKKHSDNSGFDEFWDKWRKVMIGQNPSPKQDSYRWWCKLSSQECLQAINCIPIYKRTNDQINYLKRANTYLKEKMWESLTTVRQQPKAEVMPDMNVNLRGAF